MIIPNGFYRVSIKAIIRNDEGKFLLFREDNGFWDFPGGAMNFGETPQDALKREVKEECGLNLTKIGSKPKHLLVLNNVDKAWRILIFLEAEIEMGNITPSSECQELLYFGKSEIKKISAFPSVVKFFNEDED